MTSTVPVLPLSLLLKEVLILLLSLDFVLQLGILLLLIFVLLDQSAVLQLHRGDLVHVLLKVLRQLFREELIHILLQVG